MCKHDTRSNGFAFMTRYIMRAKETRAQYITQNLALHPHAHDTFLWLFWDNRHSFSPWSCFWGNRESSRRKSLYSSSRSKPGLLKGASPEITLIRSVHHAPMLRGRGKRCRACIRARIAVSSIGMGRGPWMRARSSVALSRDFLPRGRMFCQAAGVIMCERNAVGSYYARPAA